MAVAFFRAKLKPGASITDLKMGPLGMIKHPERRHKLEVKKSDVDIEFGVTEDDIRSVYNWFKEPSHRVVIVIGGTGSGKSTKFVDWLATPPDGIPEDFFTRFGQIIIGQPRRVAAAGSADFGAQIDGGTLGVGGIWGYTHGGEKKADRRNLVVQKTHGQVLNMIEGGELKNVGMVMVDEAHERSLEIDSILRNLKEQLPIHPHLRVVIASATVDPKMFVKYFGAESTTIVEFKAIEKHSYKNPKTGAVDFAEKELPYNDLPKLAKMLPEKASELANQVITDIQNAALSKGDILVFMPGKREVEEAVENLKAVSRKSKAGRKYKVLVLPLYRGLDDEVAKATITAEETPDTIRVLVATNIAEASVTIKSLVYVVETGLAKVPVWEKSLGQTKIPLTLISQANARQRWGRAGRVRDGRVFTLYTMTQYESLMPEYPKPDIQRLNLENLVLNGRAAGLANLSKGWLEEPPTDEVERALTVLTKVKALDKDNSLTDYGRLIRRFNYPAEIVDMLLSADLKGCLVEIGTLVPMIRNGGVRQVLLWDKRWSAQTKYEVHKVHKALMAGCKDDVEFLLKIFSSWEKGTPEQREAWAKRNFVRHEAMLKIAEEREEEIFSAFYTHKKDKSFRSIEPGLISRAKDLLMKHFGGDAIEPGTDSEGRYQYRSRPESVEKSLLTFSSLNFSEEPNLSERLFCDQLLPVNCVYTVRVAKVKGEFAEVEIMGKVGALPIMERRSDGAEEKDEEEDIEDEAEEKEKKAKEVTDVKKVEELAKMVTIGRFTFPVIMKIGNPQDYKVGQKLEAVVESFGYRANAIYALLREAPKDADFAAFGDHFNVGAEVELTVTQLGNYPDDPEVSLITEVGGLTIALDPEDVIFAYTKSALSLIPIGAKLKATVVDMDIKNRYVKTSALPEAEKEMNHLFQKSAGSGGKASVPAEVLGYDEHSVHLILNWSAPEKGLLFVVSRRLDKWHKPLEETRAGEKYEATLSFHADWDNKVRLAELPEEVNKILGQRMATNLKYEEGKLVFLGRMPNGTLQELLKVSKDSEFRRAVRKLYWKSNQPFVGKLVGDISQLAVGQKFIGEVANPADFGVFVKTPIGIDGLLHESVLKPKLPKDFPSGMKVEVKVIGLDPANKKIRLDLVRIVS
jgi:hypothetical protein